jgi:hypothetical protein
VTTQLTGVATLVALRMQRVRAPRRFKCAAPRRFKCAAPRRFKCAAPRHPNAFFQNKFLEFREFKKKTVFCMCL